MRQIRNQNGFILATVLLFLIVLTVTAFFAAAMTRTDVQVVNNVQNEKEALAIAEAGVHEALFRMSMSGSGAAGAPGAYPVTIGGTTFNPSLSPSVAASGSDIARDTTSGASPYGLDGLTPNPASTAQILLNTTPPVAGADSTVPTLQPVASRLQYGTVKMSWETCTANSILTGCDPTNGATHIRKLPVSKPRPVAKIESTGQSGNAEQKVTVWAVDLPSTEEGSGLPSMVGLGDGCTDGISMNGTTSITAVGAVQINAGASDTTSPPCAGITTGGAQSLISASEISTSGNATGNYSPPPNTGAIPGTDPLNGLLPPCFGSIVSGCQIVGTLVPQNYSTNPSLPTSCTGTATAPVHCTLTTGVTLYPGIYYGGISIAGNTTLSPGVYIIAGSKPGTGANDPRISFQMSTGNTGTTSIGAGGVTVYNTRDDDPAHQTGYGDYGQLTLGTGNATVSLVASTSGYYQGISFFQDRSNSLTVDLTGGNSGNYTLDGVIYAPTAPVSLQGHTNEVIGGSIIAYGPFALGGGSNITIGNPGTPCAQCNLNGGIRYVPIAWQDF